MYEKFVSTLSYKKYKKLVGISSDLQLWCIADKDELIRSEGQWSRSSETAYGQLSALGLPGMHGPISWNLSQLFITGSTWHWWCFQGHRFKGLSHRQHTVHFTVEAVWSAVCHRMPSSLIKGCCCHVYCIVHCVNLGQGLCWLVRGKITFLLYAEISCIPVLCHMLPMQIL